MPIDFHLHIGPKPGESLEQRADNLCRTMDRFGVTEALVLPLAGLFSNCSDNAPDNNFVHQFCSIRPDRLIPAFTINPYSGERALDEIRRCKELGCKLLKLHPWLQGFSISIEQMDAVAALCAELSIPMLLHDGTPPYSAPLQLARLCRDFPKLRVVSGHAGLSDLWYEALLGARRYRNFYLCFCGTAAFPIKTIIQEIPADQLCIGSDWINGTEDVFWYRWSLWQQIPMSAEIRNTIENVTPNIILGRAPASK